MADPEMRPRRRLNKPVQIGARRYGKEYVRESGTDDNPIPAPGYENTSGED